MRTLENIGVLCAMLVWSLGTIRAFVQIVKKEE